MDDKSKQETMEALIEVQTRPIGNVDKMGVWMFDLLDQSVIWSEEVYKIHEVPYGFIPNSENIVGFYNEASKKIFQKAIDSTFKTGTSFDLNLIMTLASGKIKNIRSWGEALRDFNGNIVSVLGTIQDLSERKRAENAEGRAEQFKRSLIEAMTEPFFDISCAGEIMDVNRAAEGLTGRLREVLIGTRFEDCVAEPSKAWEGIQRLLKTNIMCDYEVDIKRKDGSFIPVKVNASVYKDEDGIVKGIFAFIDDRTKYKMEMPVGMVNRDKAEMTKLQFLSNVSHEFRTPLNGIYGMMQLMLTTPLSEEQQEYFNIQEQAVRRVTRLVDNVLILLELEDQTLAPAVLEMVDIEELIQKCVKTKKHLYTEICPEVRLVMPEALDRQCCLDTKNLHLAMDQVIDNAIKFSDNQPVYIHANRIIDKGEDAIRIDICDQGKGMHPESIKALSQFFATHKDAMHKSMTGLGIGLSIAKEAA